MRGGSAVVGFRNLLSNEYSMKDQRATFPIQAMREEEQIELQTVNIARSDLDAFRLMQDHRH